MESNYLLRGHLDKHYPQVSNLEMTQHISRNTVHKKNLKIWKGVGKKGNIESCGSRTGVGAT